MVSPLLYAEIDLQAIDHNVRQLRKILSPDTLLLAAVKGNAYGHGAIEISRRLLENGVNYLGVARIEEGIQLRQKSINAPVLIFGYVKPDDAEDLIRYDLTMTISSLKNGQALSARAKSVGQLIKAHIKIDTGMGRLGISTNGRCCDGNRQNAQVIKEIKSISELENIKIEGIYTHFASADNADNTFSKHQFALFSDLLNDLAEAHMNFPLCHASNSAAIISLSEFRLNMVRSGIAVYGLTPSETMDLSDTDLKPVMSIKAKIIHLKEVPAGFRVSYGSTYVTSKPTTIATVPIGYADGFSRLLSSKGSMLVGGRRVPIVGRVCMDLTMLDIGQLPDVKIEDEVVILGKQGDEEISADEIAALANTINYEVVSSITARVPRLIKGGNA